MFIDSSSEERNVMKNELSKYRSGVNVLSVNNIIVANKNTVYLKTILHRKVLKQEMLF